MPYFNVSDPNISQFRLLQLPMPDNRIKLMPYSHASFTRISFSAQRHAPCIVGGGVAGAIWSLYYVTRVPTKEDVQIRGCD